MSVIFVDLETQSAANLASVGTTRYLRDPSTRLMCLAAVSEGQAILWIPPGRSPPLGSLTYWDVWPDGFEPMPLDVYDSAECPDPLAIAALSGATFVAHNAYGFDAPAWEALGLPGQPTWEDTAPRCRAAGLSAKLDVLGERFTGSGKDDAGKKVMLLLTKAKVNAALRVQYPVGTAVAWRDLLRYTLVDVLLLQRVYDATGLSPDESRVLAADRAINARGVPLDEGFARHVLQLWHDWQHKATDELSELTGGAITDENVRSLKQVTAWFLSRGLRLSSLERKQLEVFFADPDEYDGWLLEDRDDGTTGLLVAALRLRQQSVRATRGKVSKAIDCVNADGRARNLLVYHGAHTGRWTGRELQPHNMPRGISELDMGAVLADYYAGTLTLGRVIEHAALTSVPAKRKVSPDEVLTSLFRPIVRASPGNVLCIADYAGIEMRGVAWQCNVASLLSQLTEEGADPYKEMASRIFGVPVASVTKDQRFIGKETVLGSGYGMGAAKFEAMCKLRSPPVDLSKAGTSAEACIRIYRETFPEIVAGWKWLQLSALSCFWHPKQTYWRHQLAKLDAVYACGFALRGDALEMYLPSGRVMRFRNAELGEYPPGEEFVKACVAGGMPEAQARKPVPQISFLHPRGYRARLYGGCLMENLVQAMCRDLMASALIRLADAGLNVVLHVHDEIVVECPEGRAAETLATLCEVMSKGPDWAAGFPVKVEGFAGKHYTKSPVKGYPTCTAMGGKVNA